jgi:hypothetical protein
LIFAKIARIGFGRKNQLSPQCVHTWANGTGYIVMDEMKMSMSKNLKKICLNRM